MKKNNTAVLLTVLIIATTAFIWWQSLRPASDSMVSSNGLKQWLIDLLGGWVEDAFTFVNIRKIAHVVEFALLGSQWCGLMLVQRQPRRRWWLPPVGGLTAVVDELLQFFSPGRAPAVVDVLLDWMGYAAGIGAVLLGVRLWKRRRNPRL